MQLPLFSREGMKAKKRVTVLVFSVIMTFIGRMVFLNLQNYKTL